MTITEIVAANIKRARRKRGLTQADIARVMNIEESVYNKIENGKIMISLDKLDKVALYIKKPVSYLLYGILEDERAPKLQKITYGESLILHDLEEIKRRLDGDTK